MISKICLGTVQFGQDYGIANTRGKVPKEEVFEIFNYAQNIGLNVLDTSIAYGESEKIIGEFIKQESATFDVITKIILNNEISGTENVKKWLQDSLDRLNVDQLYGCLIHRFEDYLKDSGLYDALIAFKGEGRVKKIGFSLYKPEELDQLWNRGVKFDMVQVPYSILDRRFEKYFKPLKEKNIEIHVRSIFLQGLVLLQPSEWPEKLRYASGPVNELQKISQKLDLPISAICLNYALLNSHISKVVIGVDGIEHLKSNILELKNFDKVSLLHGDLKDLSITDEEVLLPYKW